MNDQKTRPQLNSLEVFNFQKTTVIAGNMTIGEVIALKPVVENMGLDWSSQLKRLKREDPNGQLWSQQNYIADDGKNRDMVCMTPFNFQNWLYGFTPSENMNVALWEEYKKGLVLHLLLMLKISMQEVIRLQQIEREFEYFMDRFMLSVQLNEDSSEYNKKAKEGWREKKSVDTELVDFVKNKKSPQLSLEM